LSLHCSGSEASSTGVRDRPTLGGRTPSGNIFQKQRKALLGLLEQAACRAWGQSSWNSTEQQRHVDNSRTRLSDCLLSLEKSHVRPGRPSHASWGRNRNLICWPRPFGGGRAARQPARAGARCQVIWLGLQLSRHDSLACVLGGRPQAPRATSPAAEGPWENLLCTASRNQNITPSLREG
jgi:hypothetical protein